jgi:tellurite resistance protein
MTKTVSQRILDCVDTHGYFDKRRAFRLFRDVRPERKLHDNVMRVARHLANSKVLRNKNGVFTAR